MYRRAGLVALSLFGAASAQNKCWVCTENTPITDLTNSNGACYFTTTLDSNDAAVLVDCTGSCYVKYTSQDGILQTVDRGCIADTATSTVTETDFEFVTGTATTVADLTGEDQMCEIDTTAGGLVAHQNGNTFDANLDANRLTDLTCAKICKAGTSACNGGANYEVETLSDCDGQCKDTSVCSCDHWTGVQTYSCAQASNAALGYTERPVLNDGAWECQPYVCTGAELCVNVDSSTDPATETPITGAGCYGNGQPNSSGKCECDSFGTATTNEALPFSGGQFLDKSDTANKICSAITCTDCTGTGQQCQHAFLADSGTGTCGCATVGDVQNSDNTACETPVKPNPTCQQCSSDLETGSDCANGAVTPTSCADASAKCAAVSTLWINANGESIREVVERGCSSDTVVKDTCEFQTISTTPNADQSSEFDVTTVTEVTCRYVCEGDNCNDKLADGLDTSEPTKRSCNVGVVCEGIAGCKDVSDFTADVVSGYTATPCDNIEGVEALCVAHMSYLEHQRFDNVYERSLTHLEYKCQKADDVATKDLSETSQSCSTSTITVGQGNFAPEAKTDYLSTVRGVINMHTCMTVCDSDNCNNAWPGQPTCYTCNSAEDTETDGTTLKNVADPDHCFTNVDMAMACTNYFDNACYVTQSGLDLTSNWAVKSMNPYSAMQSMGAYKKISRGCATASEATVMEGMIMTRDESQNQHAYTDRMVICKDNGCNFGPALPTPEN